MLLQNVCNQLANTLQWIPEGYCTKVAISLQNLCKFQWFCKSYATTLQKFAVVLQGILQKCAISLQKHCKILQNFAHERNLSRPQFCIILQTIRCTLWEMGSRFCKKSAKNRMVNFPGKSWTSVKKTLCFSYLDFLEFTITA